MRGREGEFQKKSKEAPNGGAAQSVREIMLRKEIAGMEGFPE